MIRNKNIIFLTFLAFALNISSALFASAASAGASSAATAAAATAAPAATQAMGTLASLDSNLGHIAGIGVSTAKISAIVAAPFCAWYGGRAFWAWWNQSAAIKADTEAIRKTQKAHGKDIKEIGDRQLEHGRVLSEVRADQKTHGEGIEQMRLGKSAWQIAQAQAVAKSNSLLEIMGVKVDKIQTQVSDLGAVVAKNELARQRDAENHQMGLEDVRGMVAQLALESAAARTAALAAKTAAEAASKQAGEATAASIANGVAIAAARKANDEAHTKTQVALTDLRANLNRNHTSLTQTVRDNGVPAAIKSPLVRLALSGSNGATRASISGQSDDLN